MSVSPIAFIYVLGRFAFLFLTWRSPSVSRSFADALVPDAMPPDLLD